jgi:hypothetical protein
MLAKTVLIKTIRSQKQPVTLVPAKTITQHVQIMLQCMIAIKQVLMEKSFRNNAANLAMVEVEEVQAHALMVTSTATVHKLNPWWAVITTSTPSPRLEMYAVNHADRTKKQMSQLKTDI